MSIHIDPSGRRRVDPGDLDRGQVRRLRRVAGRRRTSRPASPPAEVAEVDTPPDGRARARAIAEAAWCPPSVEAYMEDPWPFERADLPDPGIRF